MLHSHAKVEDEGLDVSCSWEIVNNKCMNDAVSLSSTLQKGEKNDLANVVTLESCVHLMSRDIAPCEVKLKFGALKTLQIKKMSVVSEARIIEVYGKCEEYITTCHAEFFDECEDMSVYVAEVELAQSSSECLLKFARLKTKDEMWLYGIHVVVEKVEPFVASVNFHNVNRILKDSGHQLTEKAEKCKKFLQLYGSYLDPSKTQVPKGPDPQVLMKMFEAEYLAQPNPFSARARSVSKCLTEILPGFTMSTKEKSANEDEACYVGNPDCDRDVKLDHVVDRLTHHIDKKFSEYERHLVSKVEEKLQELERKQNEKLDLILNSLEDLKGNIRVPEG